MHVLKLMVQLIGCLKMASLCYDGQLKSLPCLVEDYVYDDLNTTSRDLIM